MVSEDAWQFLPIHGRILAVFGCCPDGLIGAAPKRLCELGMVENPAPHPLFKSS
jgi:hypothetical protein